MAERRHLAIVRPVPPELREAGITGVVRENAAPRLKGVGEMFVRFFKAEIDERFPRSGGQGCNRPRSPSE